MSKKTTIFPFCLLLLACHGDDDSASSDTQGCNVGWEGCACMDGLCGPGLTCVSLVCVDLGGATTAATSSTSEASTSETSTTSDGMCSSNEDCADDEVCAVTCTPIMDDLEFEVIVSVFQPSSCSDGVGTAEPYFRYYLDDAFVEKSPEGACPASWWDIPLLYPAGHSFKIQFWEADAFSDDVYGTLCWGADCVAEVPTEVLHAGEWSGYIGSNHQHYVEVYFNAWW